jgi:hypothetical protein
VSWYSLFVRKYPVLVHETIPFFAEPLFPCPWTYHPAVAKDATLTKIGAWMNGADTAEVMISWIGRALLAKGLDSADIGNMIEVSHTLMTYKSLHLDLCSAIDTWLCNDLVHGMATAPTKLDIVSLFLKAVLTKLKESSNTGERYGLILGQHLSMSNLDAEN